MTARAIERMNVGSTMVFLVSAVVAAALFRPPFTTVAVVVDLACFAGGVAAFLWGYWTAVQRSRTDEISVASMYFLLGPVAPTGTARVMNGSLAAQVLIGLSTALARGSTDGKAGSTLAFGILVPMLGLGLNGLWAANHGVFPARDVGAADGVAHSGGSTGQDVGHD